MFKGNQSGRFPVSAHPCIRASALSPAASHFCGCCTCMVCPCVLKNHLVGDETYPHGVGPCNIGFPISRCSRSLVQILPTTYQFPGHFALHSSLQTMFYNLTQLKIFQAKHLQILTMDSRMSVEKPVPGVELVERVEQHCLHFYAPRTSQERELDRSINMKLDFIILPLLALNFMVGRSSALSYFARTSRP